MKRLALMGAMAAAVALDTRGHEALVSPAGWGETKVDPEDTRTARRERYADYKPKPKELTDADCAAMKRAEEKRERRAAKRRALASGYDVPHLPKKDQMGRTS